MVKILLATLLMAGAQATPPANPPEGVWRGTSLCQIKPSACHDETIVYHIIKAQPPRSYRIVMSKIVAGEEQDMGEIAAQFDAATRTLRGTNRDRQQRTNLWAFVLNGNRLSGRLVTSDGRLFRLISATRDGG